MEKSVRVNTISHSASNFVKHKLINSQSFVQVLQSDQSLFAICFQNHCTSTFYFQLLELKADLDYKKQTGHP